MLLELKDIDKKFKNADNSGESVILKKLSFDIKKGESIAIIGPSGSGKSTLLNIMGALDTPDSGTVSLMGRDYSKMSDSELAEMRNRDIGFIFQLHHLLPQCTVLENVLIPLIPFYKKINDKLVKRAKNLINRVGLADKSNNHPGQLSGGECQRVAVIRALINDPHLILADEPTGSLDTKTSKGLSDLLLQLNKEENKGLIVVTHSVELAGSMSKTYRLFNGSLHPDKI